jgi:hypothetical protein
MFSAFASAATYIDLPPEHNPLHEPAVLADGDIFLPPSLFLAARDESEFAGALARLLTDWIKADPAALLHSLPANATSTSNPPSALNATFAECLHCVLPSPVLAERRKVELQADKSAVLVMSRAGFDPAALLRYIERVQPPDAKAGVNSHFYDQSVSPFPARADRIAGLRKALRALPASGGTQSEEFSQFRNRCVPACLKFRSRRVRYRQPARGALIPQ